MVHVIGGGYCEEGARLKEHGHCGGRGHCDAWNHSVESKMPTGDSCVGANTYITLPFVILDLNTARLLQFGLSPSDHLSTVRRSCSVVVEVLPPALYCQKYISSSGKQQESWEMFMFCFWSFSFF